MAAALQNEVQGLLKERDGEATALKANSDSQRLSLSSTRAETMISHQTLYSLANSLGVLAMATVVGYHFVAVNAKYLSKAKSP
ncbi:hypothetical protein B0H12DRAFT_1235891 [Mycena haematopus]|nr:hypothetical protein B0H12DRAFT_1235891 [Mycena haematopus]